MGKGDRMAGELATLAAEAAPFVTAYGAAVLEKTKDDLADGTVGLGKRLLQLIFRGKKEDEQLPDIVVEAVENPDDNAVRGALEYTIRKALENDAQMLAEVREILAGAGPRMKITQNVRAGRNAYVVGYGNIDVTRTPDLAGATRCPPGLSAADLRMLLAVQAHVVRRHEHRPEVLVQFPRRRERLPARARARRQHRAQPGGTLGHLGHRQPQHARSRAVGIRRLRWLHRQQFPEQPVHHLQQLPHREQRYLASVQRLALVSHGPSLLLGAWRGAAVPPTPP